MTRVAKMRAKNKDAFAAQYGMSLTFLPLAWPAVDALAYLSTSAERIDRRDQHRLSQ